MVDHRIGPRGADRTGTRTEHETIVPAEAAARARWVDDGGFEPGPENESRISATTTLAASPHAVPARRLGTATVTAEPGRVRSE